MRLQLAVSAAAIALLSAGAVQAQTVGYLGANYEYMHLGGFDASGSAYRVDGAAAFRAGLVGGQIDVGGTYYGADMGNYGGTVHLNLHSDKAIGGVFAGALNSKNETFWGFGVEGQANLGPALVYAQVGWGKTDLLKGVDFWAGRLQGAYYINDNFKLAAYGGYTRGSLANGPGHLDMWNLGAEAEYKLDGAPLSFIVGYEHSELRKTALTTDLGKIGVRYSFGGSLRERDQTGGALGSTANLFGGDVGQFLTSYFGEIRDEIQ